MKYLERGGIKAIASAVGRWVVGSGAGIMSLTKDGFSHAFNK